jgi:hypothetical protein
MEARSLGSGISPRERSEVVELPQPNVVELLHQRLKFASSYEIFSTVTGVQAEEYRAATWGPCSGRISLGGTPRAGTDPGILGADADTEPRGLATPRRPEALSDGLRVAHALSVAGLLAVALALSWNPSRGLEI